MMETEFPHGKEACVLTTTVSPPKLDLVPHHLMEMQLSWFLPDIDPLAQELREIVDTYPTLFLSLGFPDVPESFVSMSSYRRSGQQHACVEEIVLVPESAMTTASLVYRRSTEELPLPSGRVPKDLDHSGLLFGRLIGTYRPLIAEVSATFAFPPGKRHPPSTLLDRLSIDIAPGDEDLFDAIEGIRGVKYDKTSSDPLDKVSYDFELDRLPDGTITLLTTAPMEIRVEQMTPVRIMEQVTELAGRLIRLR
jgi:hypothetical protein